MKIKESWAEISTPYGVIPSYCAAQDFKTEPVPGVIVIQEVWGVDEHIKDVTRRIAQAGYFAVAPDLLSLGGERDKAVSHERISELKDFVNSLPPSAWGDPSKREEAMSKFDKDKQDRLNETQTIAFSQIGRMDDFVNALSHVSKWMQSNGPTRNGRIGAVGFCMGGAIAARLALSDAGLSASAIFYGSAPDEGSLKCNLIGFYGGLDENVNKTIPNLEKIAGNSEFNFSSFIYPGAAHGFHNDTRPSYHENASRDAVARLLEFFAQNLTPDRAGTIN